MHVSTEQVQQHSNKAMGERVKKKKVNIFDSSYLGIWDYPDNSRENNCQSSDLTQGLRKDCD